MLIVHHPSYLKWLRLKSQDEKKHKKRLFKPKEILIMILDLI
ncbi:unnamed protein product [Paramecium pentaurelia]|uniref:Uncharacterized protein n=1 Tax=Paramecium pentaurelia TaxID=43138 RepID=A0A8S1XW22_9CILI|nr:unnamed protein product [Paramecium pentaurelia]